MEPLMKKYITTFIFSIMAMSMNAQIMRAEELEKYAKENFGEKWNEAALNLGSQLSLDKNNSLTYTQVIECGTQTKEQLYVILNYCIFIFFIAFNYFF